MILSFTQDQVRTSGGNEALRKYRLAAWDSLSEPANLPTVKEEAWRRTDLRMLKVNSFRLPEKDVYKHLAVTA